MQIKKKKGQTNEEEKRNRSVSQLTTNTKRRGGGEGARLGERRCNVQLSDFHRFVDTHNETNQ